MSSSVLVDFNKILRTVRQDFRVVELKELLSVYGYGTCRSLHKANLQQRVEELLKSDKRVQVAKSIQQISNRLNNSSSNREEMVRGGQSSSYNSARYQQNHPTMGRPATFGMPAQNFNASQHDPSKVRLVPLPFYDVNQILLAPTVLSPNYKNDAVTMSSRYVVTVPAIILSKLSYRDTDSLPRYEIQMRMALCEPSAEQSDSFPNGVKVMINGALVNLPPLLNVQPQPGQSRSDQQKRVSKPVNITPYFNSTRDQNYQLTVEWQTDLRNVFIVGIWVVYHIDSTILRDRLISTGPKFYEETRQMIRTNLGGRSEDDIAMDSLKISLICPLSRVKMITPVRSRNCTHLQCFDLHNYLMMNEKRPAWKCPVCNKPCAYSILVIDSYFAEIIQELRGNGNEVELLPDGGWRIAEDKPSKKTVVSNVVGSSAPASVIKPESVEKQGEISAPSSSKPPQSAPDIITLDDSDEENHANPDIPSASTSNSIPAPSQQESRKRAYDQVSSVDKQDFTVITLGDSDDDEGPPSPAQPHVNQNYRVNATVDPTETALSLSDSKILFDNNQDDTLTSLDSASVLEISNALYKFMESLQNDNKNYNA